MIRQEDFRIRIGQSCSATCVQVTHRPTGKTRSADQSHGEPVSEARERLIRELTGEVYPPNEFRVDTMRTSDGDLIRVTHLPSGRSKQASESNSRDLTACDVPLLSGGRVPATPCQSMDHRDSRRYAFFSSHPMKYLSGETHVRKQKHCQPS